MERDPLASSASSRASSYRHIHDAIQFSIDWSIADEENKRRQALGWIVSSVLIRPDPNEPTKEQRNEADVNPAVPGDGNQGSKEAAKGKESSASTAREQGESKSGAEGENPAPGGVHPKPMQKKNGSYTRDIAWHNGATGGYRSFLAVDRTMKRGIAILANNNKPMDLLGLSILASDELFNLEFPLKEL